MTALPQPQPTPTPRQRPGPRLMAIATLRPMATPGWLRALGWGQWISLGVTVGLATTTLGVYGASVQTQNQINQATSRLQFLQQRQAQLITGSTLLRHHLDQQTAAVGQSELREAAIFLRPPAQAPTPAQELPSLAPPPARPVRPLGY